MMYSTIFRIIIISVLCFSLFTALGFAGDTPSVTTQKNSGQTNLQQQNRDDQLVRQANILLKDYTPKPEPPALPAETPAEAWQTFYLQKQISAKQKADEFNSRMKAAVPKQEQTQPDEVRKKIESSLKNNSSFLALTKLHEERTNRSSDVTRRNHADQIRQYGQLQKFIQPKRSSGTTSNTISGYVYTDANGNGIKDSSESGIEGLTLYAYGAINPYAIYAYTDSLGFFAFTFVLEDSQLYVHTDYYYGSVPSGYGSQSEPPSPGFYTFDYDGSDIALNFGYVPIRPTIIQGHVYEDININGVKDSGEPALVSKVIYANTYYSGSQSAVTDSNGNYSLNFLFSYTYEYVTLSMVVEPGWAISQPSDGLYSTYYFEDDSTYTGFDFGTYQIPNSTFSGMKFNDANGNRVLDSGEVGIADWVFNINDLYYDTTDANGEFSISAPVLGTVTLSEVMQPGWEQSFPIGNYAIEVTPGNTYLNNNFGNWQPPLRVNTMPSYGVNGAYANGLVNQPLNIWGNVDGGTPPYEYWLDYGDGTIDSGTVTDPHYIGNAHIYTTAGTRTMRMTVRDGVNSIEYDESVIRVFAATTPEIEVNMAIERGLLRLYLTQYPNGSWYGSYNSIGSTGLSLLAFEENGHLPTNNFDSDIYAEFVRVGLNYLFSQSSSMEISVQPNGDPDSDGDGYGAYLHEDNYANGIGLLAIIAAHRTATSAQSDIIPLGIHNGTSYLHFIIDALDQLSYAQTDFLIGRGGWRYSIATSSYGTSDNSAVQWSALAYEAAQSAWGIPVPQFVKDELLLWLTYSQHTDGGFGYSNVGDWNNIAKTAAGIGSLVTTGATSASPAVQSALAFLNNHWYDTQDSYSPEHFNGNMYAMYGVAKGMRIIDNHTGLTNIGTHNWYQEYRDHLLYHSTYGQKSNGSWQDFYWVNNDGEMGTAFGILILTQGVVVPPPVAVIDPISSRPPNTSFTVNGSNSYHQDASKSIIEYLWDFDASDGIDFSNPDAVGTTPTNPGYADTGTYTVTLRVKDNSEPPLYDMETATVEIQTANNAPVAVAIPPGGSPTYAGRVGEPILLDGSASYDPDFPADSVVAFEWDTDGDGSYDDATTDTVTVVFNSEYNGQVGLRVYDTHGAFSTNNAYITIVTSRKDIYVESFMTEPYNASSGENIHFVAIFKNDDESNVDVSNVMVKFYDENPFTTGNQLGGNYVVELPIGKRDTIDTYITLPTLPYGERELYVYLDANQQVGEWDELNNLSSSDVFVSDSGSVQGMKFNDVNGNGEKDNDEPGLAGWTIFLYQRDEVTIIRTDSTVTDSSGRYSFTNIPSGTYTVVEENRIGWQQTFPGGGYDYVVQPGDVYYNVDFGNKFVGNGRNISFDRNCINFPTVRPGEFLSLPLTLTNGSPSATEVSFLSTDAAFDVVNSGSPVINPGESLTVDVFFSPMYPGDYFASLLVVAGSITDTLFLAGQGELETAGTGQQIFAGLATMHGMVAPKHAVVLALTTSYQLIKASLVQLPPDSVMEGINYALSIQEGQAGVEAGDTILFGINFGCDLQFERICGATIFQPGFPPEGGYTWHDIIGVDFRSVNIALREGYNTVAWNVLPYDQSIMGVFGNALASGNVKIILDYVNDGATQPRFDFFIPALGEYNPLQLTDFRKGYFVNMWDDEDEMQIWGQPVCATIPLTLFPGYNFVSYLPEHVYHVSTVLSSLGVNLNIALDWVNDDGYQYFDYYPDGGFEFMHEGKGYFLNVHNPSYFVYPDVEDSIGMTTKGKQTAGNSTRKTLSSSGFPEAVFAYGKNVRLNGTVIAKGTDIKAIDDDGVICGMAKFLADGIFALPILADNPSTAQDEGASKDELVKVYIGNQLLSQRVKWTKFGDTPVLNGNLNILAAGDANTIPQQFVLHQNYPNPFNPNTSIKYELPAAASVTLKIYDMLGQEVRTLVDENQEVGFFEVTWDGTNNSGQPVSSGIYTYRLTANDGKETFVQSYKMILMK
ncbi:MAG: T9SS type A sorting domain-containing protein [Ignavibacteriae bacterium]|nr:T9SS type A sorting domain-containing protein [Ignavibacteriota bacterium]